MRLTKQQLKKLIKEELEAVMNEDSIVEEKILQRGMSGMAHKAAGAFAKFAMKASGGQSLMDEQEALELVDEFVAEFPQYDAEIVRKIIAKQSYRSDTGSGGEIDLS